MGLINNSADLALLFQSVSLKFNQIYLSTPTELLSKIGSEVPSSTRDQRYPIAQAISGAMRHWVGPRVMNNIKLDALVVTNLPWEGTIAVSREDVMDDQYASFTGMIVPNLARNAKLLPDREISAVIEANATTYDGVPFFSNAHPIDPSGVNPGTQSNDMGTTFPLNSTNLAKAQAALKSLKGPDTQPLGNVGTVILTCPSLEYTADTLANAAFYPEAKNGASGIFGAQTNTFAGKYMSVSTPWLTDSGDPTTAVWYLFDCRFPEFRPVFWQTRLAPELTPQVDPALPNVFELNEYRFGAYARGAASLGVWFKAVRCNHA